MSTKLEQVLNRVRQGEVQPLYLVHGDAVLAEPQAMSIAEALAERAGCEVDVRRRPATLSPLLADLRTLSLFSTGRVLVAIESASLADASAAAALVDEIEEVLPVEVDAPLEGRQKQAGGRLLQALRLHGLDPEAGSPEQVLSRLPDEALKGATGGRRRRARGSRQIETLRAQLAALLAAARGAELRGWDESEMSDLNRMLLEGLPAGHALVLAERDVAVNHPIVRMLEERNAIVAVGEVSAARGGAWQGVERLAAELERETGSRLSDRALVELTRRTLRKGSGTWGEERASGDSTARFAAEYRKLATMVEQGTIEERDVERAVEDRGEEDVWQILDALGGGQVSAAIERYSRWMQSAEDPAAAIFSFFGLLAGYCKNLAAVSGVLQATGLARGENHYGRFKSRIAPALQGELPDGSQSPLAGIHPFRLHRTYLAAGRMRPGRAARLPWLVLEAELRLKGDSDAANVIIPELLVEIASSSMS